MMKSDQQKARLVGLYQCLHYAIVRSMAIPNDPSFIRVWGRWLPDGDLIVWVREAREKLLATGFDVPDSWLTVPVVKLSAPDQDSIAKVAREISAAHLRLECQPAKKASIGKDEANIIARRILRKRGRNIPTARELAALVPCSLGMISELPAWKAVQETKKGSRKWNSKPVSLTTKMEAITGTEDDPLTALIKEHQADSEPSPLTDDPPRQEGSPRRCKVYRRR
jgi:hypothetical protein